MTVGEFKKKLECYQDDVEIFTHSYCDLTCQDSFSDPMIWQQHVRTYKTKKGYTFYTTEWHQEKSKQHIVLVVA